MMNDLMSLYQSKGVIRWHSRPQVPSQTTGEHTMGMLILLMKLHPNPSADLYEAILRHDLHEVICGDFPHEAKRDFPFLRDTDELAADKFAHDHKLRRLELSTNDYAWLKFLDQLEVMFYLHDKQNCKEIYDATEQNCIRMAKELNIEMPLLQEPSERNIAARCRIHEIEQFTKVNCFGDSKIRHCRNNNGQLAFCRLSRG